MRILHIDDDEPGRNGLAQSLTHNGFKVRGVDGPAEAFVLLQTWQPDLIVLDLVMRNETGELLYDEPVGLATAVVLNERYPHIHLLIYTGHFQFLHFPQIHALMTRKRGGFGYLLKAHTVRTIVRVIKKVGQGGKYQDPEAERQHQQRTPPHLYTYEINERLQQVVDAWPTLTPTHRHVVSLIAQGYTNQRIAVERDVKISTIDTQISSAARRLGLADKDEGSQRTWMILTYWLIHGRAQNNE